jgi:lysophospholipase L1-like esterase
MSTLLTSQYGILRELASQLGLRAVWSSSSGDAPSDVNDWLAYALSDSVQSSQLIALRERIRLLIGSNVTPGAKVLFEYYRGLLDGNGQLPSTVTPALWFNGTTGIAYQDLSGTISAVVGDPLGRMSEPSPLTSNWQAPSTALRPRRDTNGARIEYSGVGFTGTQQLTRSAIAALAFDNMTLAVSFRARDGRGASAAEGYLRCPSFGGIYGAAGSLIFTYNAFSVNWVPSIPLYGAGQQVTVVFQVTSSLIKVRGYIDGVPFSNSTVATVNAGTVASPFSIGAIMASDQGVYGTVTNALGVARAVSDAEADGIASALDSVSPRVAFPTEATSRFYAVQGDSIARDVPGTENYRAWCWMALANIRPTYPDSEMYNGAAGGAGAAGVINSALPYFASARAANVMTISVGTNDLATGSSAAVTLSTILAQYDAALSAGWRPIIATILDRTGALSVSQATYDANRATVNAGILASGRTFADLTGIAGISANGASAGANFIGDGVHPGAGGHALMEPVMRAAMLARSA